MGAWKTFSKSCCRCACTTRFTRRQWMTLFVFSLAYLFSACVTSLQAPFYPAEAERKGASATEYGLVFGIFQLVCFLISPVYGKYLNKFGAKKIFNMGIFTSGISCFFFGFLDRVEGHFLFIFLSFLIRIFEAIGSTAFVTAAFTIIAGEFPDSVATTFASLETLYGVGLIIGPSLGGALYEVGGFTAPFAFVGLCLISVALSTPWLLPNGKSMDGGDCKDTEGFGIFSILKLPAVQLAAVNIWMATNSLGFLSATLEPHLRQFNFSVLEVGLIFMLTGASYAISAPIWGKLMDKWIHPKYVIVHGALLIMASHVLIGPAPFLPFETYFPMSCIGLILHGIGIGACQVAAFILALKESIANGFPDNLNLYSVVSGMWASFLALGLFMGPSLGGVLLDQAGYRLGSLYPFIAAVVVVCK
ncbi:MFS-type transporter SLC18B1 [Orchesella cincta]|uniref:MFS-type transporter SLC18B1 n=1 Tax=Orchesella cincta TaxID=48709 RepID=A0A1D2MX95_ORCCI|nr:MFS-type transporter SLC18B1 [Orchesella cincta]